MHGSVGEEFVFRIKAKNKIGTSKPSERSDPVIANDPTSKYVENYRH